MGGIGALIQQQFNGGSDSNSLHKFLADNNNKPQSSSSLSSNNYNNHHGVQHNFPQQLAQRPSLKRRTSSASNLSRYATAATSLDAIDDDAGGACNSSSSQLACYWDDTHNHSDGYDELEDDWFIPVSP